jgi:amino-acid N-acetyltransferase
VKIVSAKVTDVKEIHKLIEFYADKGDMLHRPLSAIYENIGEFVVAKEDDKIIACGALHVSWEDLAEVKALAVECSHTRQGAGTEIVKRLEQNALELGVGRVFTLTFKPAFFKRLNYTIVAREMLPHKIWSECINCHLFPDCGEIPLLKALK